MLLSKLKAAKEAKNLTLKEIADLGNVPHTTVQRIFSGETEHPTVDTLAPICRVLGISLDAVLGIPIANDTRHEDSRLIEALESRAAALEGKYEVQKETSSLYERAVKQQKETIEKQRKTMFFLRCVISVLSITLLLLLFDAINGSLGMIRY